MVSIREQELYGKDIIRLWQLSFGDSREDIEYFLTECKNKKCLCLYNESELLSMLFLVDCRVFGTEYGYIYAACTDKKAQGKGYMSRLLSYCRDKYKNVLLVPGSESLVKFYRDRKFNHKIDIKDILFNESDGIVSGYLFEGSSLKNPFALAFEGE
ncbi:MAG: GNAT family N-acetyltransferase [Eubacterium sp.]